MNRQQPWPVNVMCRVLEVSASGYFRWSRAQSLPDDGGSDKRHLSDQALLIHIHAIHAQLKGEYGWPRMHKELLARGVRVGKERVRRLMQQHGIRARTKRKFVVTTDSKHHLPIAPDLVQRRFTPQAPNELWSGDITYIATDEGWLYLAVVLDLHSRQVVGWSLQAHMQSSLVKDALLMACWRRRPGKGLIFHSDRGSQYCSHDFQSTLQAWGARSSMSRQGNCWENKRSAVSRPPRRGRSPAQRAHRELLWAPESGLRAGAQICHPRAGESGHPGLDGSLQSQAAALVFGPSQPHAIRAAPDRSTEQRGCMTSRAMESTTQGQPH